MNQRQLATASRAKPRIPFPQKVWLQDRLHATKNELFAGNLSESGIFVQTVDAPAVGSQISLQFYLDDNNTLIEAVAEVVWIKPYESINVDGILPGVGARFTELTPHRQKLLSDYIQKQLAAIKEPAAQISDRDTLHLEKPFVLQVKGELETIYGYSKQVDHAGILFQADSIPPRSLLQRLQNNGTLENAKGCLAVPVEITAVNENDAFHLRFLELRADLLRNIHQLSGQTLDRAVVTPPATAIRSNKDNAKSTYWQQLVAIAILAWLCGFFAAHWF